MKALGEPVHSAGASPTTPSTKIDQHYLDIDAGAGTAITRMMAISAKFSYLKDDVINAAYLVQTPADVAVVGVGGGRDILSALFFGATHIRGIEINPAIFEVPPTGSPISPAISIVSRECLVNAEARSYINHSSDRYDLVQISLIDTWAATAAGGLTLTENRLYTVEAWDDFYRALKPGGMLSVSRWYNPEIIAASSIAWWRSRQTRCSTKACRRPNFAPCDRAERRQHRHRDHPAGCVHRCAMAGGARPAPGAGLHDPAGTGCRLRHRHLDIAVRKGGRCLLRARCRKMSRPRPTTMRSSSRA